MEGVLNLILGYFLGVVFPLHKPYVIQLSKRFSDSSFLGTNEMFDGQFLKELGQLRHGETAETARIEALIVHFWVEKTPALFQKNAMTCVCFFR